MMLCLPRISLKDEAAATTFLMLQLVKESIHHLHRNHGYMIAVEKQVYSFGQFLAFTIITRLTKTNRTSLFT